HAHHVDADLDHGVEQVDLGRDRRGDARGVLHPVAQGLVDHPDPGGQAEAELLNALRRFAIPVEDRALHARTGLGAVPWTRRRLTAAGPWSPRHPPTRTPPNHPPSSPPA